jgi:hypothetical protein
MRIGWSFYRIFVDHIRKLGLQVKFRSWMKHRSYVGPHAPLLLIFVEISNFSETSEIFI